MPTVAELDTLFAGPGTSAAPSASRPTVADLDRLFGIEPPPSLGRWSRNPTAVEVQEAERQRRTPGQLRDEDFYPGSQTAAALAETRAAQERTPPAPVPAPVEIPPEALTPPAQVRQEAALPPPGPVPPVREVLGGPDAATFRTPVPLGAAPPRPGPLPTTPMRVTLDPYASPLAARSPAERAAVMAGEATVPIDVPGAQPRADARMRAEPPGVPLGRPEPRVAETLQALEAEAGPWARALERGFLTTTPVLAVEAAARERGDTLTLGAVDRARQRAALREGEAPDLVARGLELAAQYLPEALIFAGGHQLGAAALQGSVRQGLEAAVQAVMARGLTREAADAAVAEAFARSAQSLASRAVTSGTTFALADVLREASGEVARGEGLDAGRIGGAGARGALAGAALGAAGRLGATTAPLTRRLPAGGGVAQGAVETAAEGVGFAAPSIALEGAPVGEALERGLETAAMFRAPRAAGAALGAVQGRRAEARAGALATPIASTEAVARLQIAAVGRRETPVVEVTIDAVPERLPGWTRDVYLPDTGHVLIYDPRQLRGPAEADAGHALAPEALDRWVAERFGTPPEPAPRATAPPEDLARRLDEQDARLREVERQAAMASWSVRTTSRDAEAPLVRPAPVTVEALDRLMAEPEAPPEVFLEAQRPEPAPASPSREAIVRTPEPEAPATERPTAPVEAPPRAVPATSTPEAIGEGAPPVRTPQDEPQATTGGVPGEAPTREALPPPIAGTPSPVHGGRVVEAPTETVQLDPERFQYKIVHGAKGETGSLRGVERYDRNLAGVVQVWRDPADGVTYAVNGHNRVALARRLGAPVLDVRYLNDFGVETAEQALAVGAITNIAELNGTALDAAKFFRATGASAEQLRSQGVPLSERLVTDGLALANLHPVLFDQVVKGDLPTARAVLFGERVPDPNDQLALAAVIAREAKRGRGITDRMVAELADMVQAAPTRTTTEATLFGPDVTTERLAVEQARLLADIRARLSGDKRLFGLVSRTKAAARLEAEGNVINRERGGEVSQEAATLLAVFDRIKHQAGPISAIIRGGVERIGKGEPRGPVTDEVYGALRKALPQALRRGEPEARGPVPGEVAALPEALKGGLGEGGGGVPGARPGGAPEPEAADRAGAGARAVPAEDSATLRLGAPEPVGTLAGGAGGGPRTPTAEPEARRAPVQAPAAQREVPGGAGLETARDLARRIGGEPELAGVGAAAPRAEIASEAEERILSPSGKAGSINLDRLDTTEDAKRLLALTVAEEPQRIASARGGRITHAETQRAADELIALGFEPEIIQRRVQAGHLTREEMLAARMWMTASAERMATTRETYRRHQRSESGEVPDAVVDELARQWIPHLNLVAAVSGEATEFGRALNAMKILAKAAKAPVLSGQARAAVTEAIARGDRGRLRQIMDEFVQLPDGDVKAQTRFMRAAPNPKWWDYFLELRTASLLWGPKTHVNNLVDNTLFALVRVGERALAGATDAVISGARGRPREVFAAEARRELEGQIHAWKRREGLEGQIYAWNSGEAWQAMALAWREATAATQKAGGGRPGVIPGLLGRAVRFPFRALTASDAAFKAMARAGTKNAMAFRIARREGLTDDALARRVTDLLRDPTVGMLRAMDREMDYRTFNGELRGWLRRLERLRNDASLAGATSRYIVPFMRVGVNVIETFLERAPGTGAALAAYRVRQIARARSDPQMALREPAALPTTAAEEIAKPLMGALLTMGFGTLAAFGLVTGNGPDDPKHKAMKRAAGWQANSFWTPAGWVNVNRLGVVGNLMGMAADAVEHLKDDHPEKAKTLIETLFATTNRQVSDESWWKGLGDLAQFRSDPDRYSRRFLEEQAASVVPFVGMLRSLSLAMDESRRVVEGSAEAVQGVVPFWRNQLPERLDPFGAPIRSDMTAVERFASPYPRSVEKPERDVERQLAALRLSIGPPAKQVTIKGKPIALLPREFRDYQAEAGPLVRTALERLLASPGFEAKDRDAQQLAVQAAVEQARARVRATIVHRVKERLAS